MQKCASKKSIGGSKRSIADLLSDEEKKVDKIRVLQKISCNMDFGDGESLDNFNLLLDSISQDFMTSEGGLDKKQIKTEKKQQY